MSDDNIVSKEFEEKVDVWIKGRMKDPIKYAPPKTRIKHKCIRCGVCCRFVDLQDRFVLSEFDKNRLIREVPEAAEHIFQNPHRPWQWKIRGTGSMGTCPFLLEGHQGRGHVCRIYDNRPFICQIYPYGYGSSFLMMKEGAAVVSWDMYDASCIGLGGKGAEFIRLKKLKRELKQMYEAVDNDTRALAERFTADLDAGMDLEEAVKKNHLEGSK